MARIESESSTTDDTLALLQSESLSLDEVAVVWEIGDSVGLHSQYGLSRCWGEFRA